MTSPRLGFTFPPTLPPEQLRRAALAAEAAGLDEFWLWEDCFKEAGISSAAAVLGWTSRIRVGIGLLPVPLRNVCLTAMEIATLDRLFPGRFRPGIGHGVQDWMGQAGVRVASPMTLLAEYTAALRRLLAGQRVSCQGRYVRLEDVALDWPPESTPALLIGGAGPKSLELAAELGDGVLLSGIQTYAEASEHVAVVRRRLRELRRTAAAPDITTTQLAATGPGAEQRLAAEAAAWGKQPGAGLGVSGGPEQIAESVLELGRRGVTVVSVAPVRDEPDLEDLIGVLGQTRALLQRS